MTRLDRVSSWEVSSSDDSSTLLNWKCSRNFSSNLHRSLLLNLTHPRYCKQQVQQKSGGGSTSILPTMFFGLKVRFPGLLSFKDIVSSSDLVMMKSLRLNLYLPVSNCERVIPKNAGLHRLYAGNPSPSSQLGVWLIWNWRRGSEVKSEIMALLKPWGSGFIRRSSVHLSWDGCFGDFRQLLELFEAS